MSPDVEIFITSAFKRQYKALKKTYRNIDCDFKALLETLHKAPKSGKSLGHGLYKVRLEGTDIPGGKRGGYRVITYFVDTDNSLYLLSIYSKRQIENISLREIKQIMKRENLLPE